MSRPTDWRRWLWWLRSRKVQVALTTVIGAVLADSFGWDLSAETILACVAVASAVILGIAHEDAAEKSAPPEEW